MKRLPGTLWALGSLLLGCRTPGQEVRLLEGDFALIEVQLRG